MLVADNLILGSGDDGGSVNHTETIFTFRNNGMINITKSICQQKCQQCRHVTRSGRRRAPKSLPVSGAVG